LPETLTKADTVVNYAEGIPWDWYDAKGNRIRKQIPILNKDEYYVLGADGATEAVYDGSGNPKFWNINGIGQSIGRLEKPSGGGINRLYYLKDHLGSVRVTVKDAQIILTDNFGGSLSQWTTTQGAGFSIINGELANSSSGENYLVNSNSSALANGFVRVDVKVVSSEHYADPSVIVRYQDVNNFYMVHPYNNYIAIYEKIGGAFYCKALGYLSSAIVAGVWYNLRIELNDGTITAYWNNQQIVTWTDTSPWLSGKVGFQQYGYRDVRWDNITVLTNMVVASYDDYDPWGLQLGGRCGNSGDANAKYKFGGKELDIESGIYHYGYRGYDAWNGRWTGEDPLAVFYPESSPYVYCNNDPVNNFDFDGLSWLHFMVREQVLILYSKEGTELGRWDASNMGDNKATGVLKNGHLDHETYEFMDQSAPYTHGVKTEILKGGKTQLLDSENGPYGTNGIFRLKTFVDSKGIKHKVVGVHSGRKNKGAWKAKTRGCIRTTDEAMKEIREVAKKDPLKKLEVDHNLDLPLIFSLPTSPVSPQSNPNSPTTTPTPIPSPEPPKPPVIAGTE